MKKEHVIIGAIGIAALAGYLYYKKKQGNNVVAAIAPSSETKPVVHDATVDTANSPIHTIANDQVQVIRDDTKNTPAPVYTPIPFIPPSEPTVIPVWAPPTPVIQPPTPIDQGSIAPPTPSNPGSIDPPGPSNPGSISVAPPPTYTSADPFAPLQNKLPTNLRAQRVKALFGLGCQMF